MEALVKTLKKLHKDEGGADMIEYVLIFAAVALPILAIILFFRNEIYEWAKDMWEGLKSDAEAPVG